MKTNPYIFRASVDGRIRIKMETMTSTVPRSWITGSRAKTKIKTNMAEQNMLLFLVTYLDLNLALFNLLLVSHRRRTILMRDIAFSRTSYRRFGSNTRLARARRFWIRPGRPSAWWDNFVSQTVVPEEWKENLRMSRPSLLKQLVRSYGHTADSRRGWSETLWKR